MGYEGPPTVSPVLSRQSSRGLGPPNLLQSGPLIERPHGPRFEDTSASVDGWRLQPQRRVGPVVVVVLPPCIGHQLRLGESGKPMLRETLSPQAAIEGLAHTIVHRLAGPTEVELHLVPVRPVIQRRRRELRPVVTLHHGG